MKKVFVIYAETGLDAIKKANKVLELKEEVEIICVQSMEDIPFNERIKSDPSTIQQIHKFSAPPILPPLTFFNERIESDPFKKGWKRPYKFNR